jgi:hypothetical protein
MQFSMSISDALQGSSSRVSTSQSARRAVAPQVVNIEKAKTLEPGFLTSYARGLK